MKNFFLTLTLAFAFFGAQAQCTPDPQFTIAGIYPDSASGLPGAIVGQAYDEVITIISPTDTSVTLFGQSLSVTVQAIELTSVTGLPPSFSYDCETANCTFSGGSTSCAVLTSPSPTVAEVGLHQIIMNTITTVDAGLFGIQTQDDVIDYYYIEVLNGTTSTLNQFNDLTFDLKGVFPNPVVNNAKIQFISGTPEAVTFKVYNLLGEEIESQFINSQRGVNTIIVNTTSYSEGMYLYSINNGKEVLTKRMIIKN